MRTTTAGSSPSWNTSRSIARRPPPAAEPPGIGCSLRHLHTPANRVSAGVPDCDLRGVPTQELTAMQSAVILSPPAPPTASPAVVSARDLVRRYGQGDTAVDALR